MRKDEFARYAGPKLRGERTVIEREQQGYPEALCDIADPPDRLFVIGNVAALREGIAIVGARNATPYGTSCAKRFARIAARRRITVISGGARGCDAAAHRAALEAKGPTVAFLGGGCDELYPASHFGLFQEIVDAGGVIADSDGGAKDAVYEAMCANPMSIEEMLGYVESQGLDEGFRMQGNAITFLMVRLAELQRSGRIVRYPDGRYGPVVV